MLCKTRKYTQNCTMDRSKVIRDTTEGSEIELEGSESDVGVDRHLNIGK